MTLLFFAPSILEGHMRPMNYHSYHVIWSWNWRCRCAGGAWKLLLGICLQNWAVSEHENPMTTILRSANCMRTGCIIVQVRDLFPSWNFLPSLLFFCCPSCVWLVPFGNSSDRFSVSGHFNSELLFDKHLFGLFYLRTSLYDGKFLLQQTAYLHSSRAVISFCSIAEPVVVPKMIRYLVNSKY
jgi:hypothetical protein